MKGPFRFKGGRISLQLTAREMEFLGELPSALEQVGSMPDHPATRRLSVPIYLDDAEAQADYQHWMQSELEEARRADRSAFALIVEAAAGGTDLSLPEAEAFLRVLAEGRLALAATLGIDFEEDYEDLEEPEAAALQYLTELQGQLIQIVSEASLRS